MQTLCALATATTRGVFMQIYLMCKVNIIKFRDENANQWLKPLGTDRGWVASKLYLTLCGGQTRKSWYKMAHKEQQETKRKLVFTGSKGSRRSVCKASAGVTLSKTNAAASGCAYESVKGVLQCWNWMSQSMSRFSFDMAEGCHITLRWMPCGRCCKEVWWGWSFPPGTTNQYASQTLSFSARAPLFFFSSHCWHSSIKLVLQ